MAESPSTIRTFRAPFDCAISKYPNRSEGLLGDVAFQAPNAAAGLLLEGDQPRGGLRQDELPRAGVGNLVPAEFGFEEAEAVPGVFRAGARRRHTPEVVVPAAILGRSLDRRPPGKVLRPQLATST